jgi:hypothetical protein
MQGDTVRADDHSGCLVIGAKFRSLTLSLSLSLLVGLFLGGAFEATASPAMLSRAGYRPKHSGVYRF